MLTRYKLFKIISKVFKYFISSEDIAQKLGITAENC